MKGEAMRILTLVAALSAVVCLQPAMAQEPMDDRPGQPPAQQTPGPASKITSINIVRFEDLPPQARSVVEAKLNETSADELRSLHASIGASRQVLTLLAQNGLDVTQVVAAALDPEGGLTLVIQDTA
jgi:hypothetical protein